MRKKRLVLTINTSTMNLKRKNFWKSFVLMISLLVLSGPIFAQVSISGKVTQKSDGTTLPGVSVLIKGTSEGTITNLDGDYSVQASEDAVLVFSFIGFLSQEIPVAGKSVINAAMESDIVALGEFVAIGYGTQRKKDVTSAIGSISSEDFDVQPITQVDQILQGRTAGVTVTRASGAPGGAAKIRIRGTNSIYLSNDPLYVIDGMVGADFESINPNDIEDLQILKDASATAIYGSRGANGVVIITTKGGQRGENKISFRANASMSEPIRYWDLLSAGDYAKTANEYNVALGNTPIFSEEEVQGFYNNGGTDWQDKILGPAFGQDYQLTVSGGNDKSTYFISGNIVDQEGIVLNSGFKRYGLRANVSSQISDKLKASFKTNFSHREALNNGSGAAGRSTLNMMLNWAPTTEAYDEFGNINPKDNIGANFENPIELATNEWKSIHNTFTANGNVVYTFFPGLSLDVGLGAKYESLHNKSFNQALLMGLDTKNAASAKRGSGENTYIANTNILTYKKVFNGVHNLTVTAVNEQTIDTYDYFDVQALRLQYPVFEYNNLSLLDDEDGLLLGSTEYRERKIQSLVGRINYVYKDRYYLTASYRRDGSSVFRGDNHWSNFPSLSAGWTVTEEDFFQNDIFSNLKLRASWGRTGNQNAWAYATEPQLKVSPVKEISTSFVKGESVPGLILGAPGNYDLKWETTEQVNYGIDVAVLNDRVSLNADYFKKNTYDLLLPMPIPSYAGGGFLFQNVGEVLNEGVELNLNAEVLRIGDFSWSTNFNATFLKNEVLHLGRDAIALGNTAGTEGQELIVMEGEPVSSFYGFEYLGTWKEDEAEEAALFGNVPGDARFLDIENDFEVDADDEFVLDDQGNKIPIHAIDSKDKKVIGSGIPTRTFGWNNTFKYKNFTLNMFIQSLTGYDRWSYTYAAAVTPGKGSNNIEHSDVLDRWDAVTNPNSDIPHFSSTTEPHLLSSRFIQDASFVRLKNLSLSYSLPLKDGRNITFMVAGTNLLTFTNYKGLDPEAFSNKGSQTQGDGLDSDAASGVDVGSYPNSKMYSFSVNINF